jgi:hypothetical protein
MLGMELARTIHEDRQREIERLLRYRAAKESGTESAPLSHLHTPRIRRPALEPTRPILGQTP